MTETLGQRIRRLREERRVRAQELCECVQLTSKALTDIEQDRSAPNLRTLYRIADAFGLTASFLIRGVQIERWAPGSKRERAAMRDAV